MKVARLYRFRARHSLPGVAGYELQHYHDYTVEVMVAGIRDAATGMVVDTQQIDDVMEPWVKAVEGTDLNDFITPSTVENLAGYLTETMGLTVRPVVRVWEDDDRWGEASA